MNHFNLVTEKEEKRVKIFCDESITHNWLYIGLLIVPEEEEQYLIRDILNNRCGNTSTKKIKDWINCKEKCKYHEKNNREVHFNRLGNDKDMYFIAKRWIEYLLCGKNYIRFYILGIDKSKLDLKKFDNKESNIYNRFFRSAVFYSLKKLIPNYKKINLIDIYHDNNSSLEGHEFFSWHCLYKIKQQDNIIITSANKINFIDSNHKESKNNYSNLIQLIDLILGSIKEIFECESPSNDNDKIKIAKEIIPLVERIINNPKNKNSKYNYFNKFDISFFPKNKIEDLEKEYGNYSKILNNFYKNKTIKIIHKKQIEFNF